MDGLKMLGESRADEGVRATKPAELALDGPDSFDFAQDRLDPAHTSRDGYEPCFSTTSAAFRADFSLR